MRYRFLSVFLGCLFAFQASAQVGGCTDIFARNYNPRAIFDDGSCCYSTQIVNPEIISELPEEVSETSGLFFHGGKVWTHNDSGGKPILYALDTADSKVLQRISLANAKNQDWEDVCTDGERVFVGDFGNNRGARRDLKIYSFLLSKLPDEGDAVIMVDSICFSFADQKDYTPRNNHDFDCEAMFATDNYLYLFSKGWKTETTRLYRLPKENGIYVADSVSGFDCKGLVTGADFDAKNNVLAVVGYKNKVWEPFLYLIYDFDESNLKAHGRRFDMPQLITTQMEGVCFYDDFKLFLSAETSPSFKTRIFGLDCRKLFYRDNEKTKPIGLVKSFKTEKGRAVVVLDTSTIRKGKYRLIVSDSEGKTVFEQNIRVRGKENIKSEFETKGNIPTIISLYGKHKAYEADLKNSTEQK